MSLAVALSTLRSRTVRAAGRGRGWTPAIAGWSLPRAARLGRCLLGPALLAITLAGCDDPAPPAPAPKAEGPATVAPRVAIVLKTLTNPFFVKMEQGARQAAEELGAELIVRTAAQETSIEQQITIVDELVETDVSAIVLAPGDSVRLIPAVKRAREAGIFVVNIDNRLDPDFLAREGIPDIPFVSVDNEDGAYRATQKLLSGAKTPAAAFVLEGIRGADNAEARRQGATRAFEEAPGVTVVATETANWKIDEAYDVTKRVFTAHPEITLVFAANDMMALGASRYLRDAGRFDVAVAGFDALDEARDAVATGALRATVDQQADLQGRTGVEYALRLLRGGGVPPVTLIDAIIVDAAATGTERETAAPQ